MVSLRLLVTAALAVATPLVSALPAVPTAQLTLTPQQIVDSIKTLSGKSQALQAPAQSITIVNGPLIIVGLGPFPPLITGFTDIVSTSTVFISQIMGIPPIEDEDEATAIANAFREFVRIHQALLNILIGKAGLFNTVPFIGGPVAAVLRQVEKVVDTIAFGLIDIIDVGLPKQRIQSDGNSLSSSLTICINAYEGLAINNKPKQA
ncbi:hypothetical protein QBC37DRAFT_80460 [Rhypophila decipiens]|uniref:UVI-1 protein n=1 Tax=Rhypophila decipiens TaxID=261697 RepID=A0AAN6YCD5_9PEZI|nr:hypothetical protein QBC37DRAFT_80460 [Rhypophila decipiens]